MPFFVRSSTAIAFRSLGRTFQRFLIATVDGSEIRLTSWGWQFIYHYLEGFVPPRWLLAISFINSMTTQKKARTLQHSFNNKPTQSRLASRAAVVEVADIAPWVCWHCSTGTFFIFLMSNEIKLFHSETSCVQTAMSLDRHLNEKKETSMPRSFSINLQQQPQNALLCCVATFGSQGLAKFKFLQLGDLGVGETQEIHAFCVVLVGFRVSAGTTNQWCHGAQGDADVRKLSRVGQSVGHKTRLEQWQ